MTNNPVNSTLKETERLKDLYLYDILDTIPEKDFDELVNIAAISTGCPIAAITFVDKDRQWFKAKKGDNVPETFRDISFCAHTILQDEPLIVQDATKDVRFLANPDVTAGLGIRFYAGVPIYSSSRKKLDAVCVIAKEPMAPTEAQIAVLTLISRQVTILLDLRLRNKLFNEHSRQLLIESEKNFQSFFAKTTLPKWIYEIDTLRFLQVNGAAQNKYGYTKEEFLKMTVFDIRTIEARKNIHELVQSIRSNNKESTFKSLHQTKSGKILNVEVSIHDIIYMGKAARVATINDLTEKIRLKKALDEERKSTGEMIAKAELNAIEETKDFIGKELHDNVNQLLASTKLYLEFAANNEEMRLDLMRRCQYNIAEAIQAVRQLSRSLVSSGENDFTLRQPLSELVNSFSTVNTFDIHLTVGDSIEELPADLKINLFRIIQEQMNNILKHAKATEVWISIKTDDSLQLRIEDNGIGFNTKRKMNGIGLKNMQKRAEFYKGTFEIESRPNNGTVVLVTLPLHEVLAV